MERKDREKLRRNLPLLARSMDFVVVSMELVSRDIFQNHHIQAFESNPVPMLKNRSMLMSLETRGPTAFQALVDSLVASEDPVQISLAEQLGYQSQTRSVNDKSQATEPTDNNAAKSAALSELPVPSPKPVNFEPDSDFSMDLDDMAESTDSADAGYSPRMTDESKAYRMAGKPRGIALIINQKQFATLPQRPASVADSASLWFTFKELGFNIILYEDMTSDGIKHVINKQAKQNHSHFDCLVVAVLSHGEEGCVYGTDGHLVKIKEDIVAAFHEDRCPSLKGKPKLFFIQAPLAKKNVEGGDQEDAAVLGKAASYVKDQASQPIKQIAGSPSSSKQLSMTISDVLLVYSHLPAHVTWRQGTGKGTMFINYLTQILKEEAKQEDLHFMVTMVGNKMTAAQESTPHIQSSLKKRVFFLPGYFQSEVETDTPIRQPSSEIYRMASKPRGKALIINNQNFTAFPTRTGTGVDGQMLTELLEWLGFKVDMRADVKKMDMLKLLGDYSRKDHCPYDCFIFAILTHGTLGSVYTSDSQEVEIEAITGSFTSDRCPSLADKPKIFILQACRGVKKDPGCDATDFPKVDEKSDPIMTPAMSSHSSEDRLVDRFINLEIMDETDSVAVRKMPTQSDMLILYATIPGYVSWRNSGAGSWLVQAINEVLRERAEKEDLLSMTTMINRHVATSFSSTTGFFKMMPAPVNMLTKKLYFFPEKIQRT